MHPRRGPALLRPPSLEGHAGEKACVRRRVLPRNSPLHYRGASLLQFHKARTPCLNTQTVISRTSQRAAVARSRGAADAPTSQHHCCSQGPLATTHYPKQSDPDRAVWSDVTPQRAGDSVIGPTNGQFCRDRIAKALVPMSLSTHQTMTCHSFGPAYRDGNSANCTAGPPCQGGVSLTAANRRETN